MRKNRLSYRLNAAFRWTEESGYYVSTPSAMARSMLFYVQEIGCFRTLPGYFTERENLDSFLIVYTLSGSGKLRYAGKTYSLPAGHAFWIDCMEPQYYEGADWDLLWVHFNGASSRAYYEQFVRIGPGPVLPLAADSTVPECIRDLLKLHREKDVRAELLSSQHIVRLLTELLLSAMGRGDARHPGWMPSYVEQAVSTLEQQYADQWTLDQLAVLCSVSKYHLAREFKKYTGFAPHEYLTNLRITAAKQLLVLSDMPVAAISQHVGHTNVSHFINLFKQEEGITPLAYRKQWHRQGRG